MDPGTTPVDADDIIQRYGRRLYVLAYHLTGDGALAHELAQECLVRSLLEQSFPPGERETAIHVIRGLVSLWRERLEPPARSGRPRGRAAASASPAPGAGERPDLWRALSRLDPTSRAVLVLRVAGDLEYETIGRILDMAADVVYARLLQARSRLRPGETAIADPVFETMNLYLDGRLVGAERSEFERRMLADAALRLRVEFHRGLTLELHEDAPPLPRDFAARIHDRLDRTRETLALVDQAVEAAGWEPVAGAPAPEATVRPRSSWGSAIGLAALVVAVAGITFWVARRLPVTPPATSSSGTARPSPAATPSATPDAETIEALRSLGYLAPARDRPARESAATPPGKETRSRQAPAAPTASPAPASTPAAAAPSPAPVEPSPPQAEATATPPALVPAPVEPTPTPVESAPAPTEPAPAPPEPATEERSAQPAALSWRVVPAGKAPEPGRDHRVIRTAPEWAALFEGAGTPEVSFDRDMVVLLRRDLPGDPPSTLVIASVRQTAEALVIECRREPSPAGAGAAGSPPGQALVLPISDLPVRVIVQ